MALRRSHFQCGKCEGRRSQSSVARTPSLALPPRWARKEFFVVVCAALLTFVCMLRYWMWNVVPIWFLYSSILIGIFCTGLTFQDRTPSPMPPSSGVPLSIPHTDRFHLSLASLYISNKTKNPRRPANTTLPDTREKRTNVKRIFTIHFATCS